MAPAQPLASRDSSLSSQDSNSPILATSSASTRPAIPARLSRNHSRYVARVERLLNTFHRRIEKLRAALPTCPCSTTSTLPASPAPPCRTLFLSTSPNGSCAAFPATSTSPGTIIGMTIKPSAPAATPGRASFRCWKKTPTSKPTSHGRRWLDAARGRQHPLDMAPSPASNNSRSPPAPAPNSTTRSACQFAGASKT